MMQVYIVLIMANILLGVVLRVTPVFAVLIGG
nr:MAG TPA: hypothetical protein [Caudoviricetes sp.]